MLEKVINVSLFLLMSSTSCLTPPPCYRLQTNNVNPSIRFATRLIAHLSLHKVSLYVNCAGAFFLLRPLAELCFEMLHVRLS